MNVTTEVKSNIQDVVKDILREINEPQYEPGHPHCQCVVIMGVWLQQDDSDCPICTSLREAYNRGMGNDEALGEHIQELINERDIE